MAADSKRYGIEVAVKPAYLADQSDPAKSQYVFAYTITIVNTGNVTAQLISRHWVITDSEHRVQEVKGLGVVGHQPLLKPGERAYFKSRLASPPPEGRNIDIRFFNKRDLAGHA